MNTLNTLHAVTDPIIPNIPPQITDNVPLEVIYWHDLTAEEREEFDWCSDQDKQDDWRGVRYQDTVLHLGDFTYTQRESGWNWDGVFGTGFFHAYVLRWEHEGESVVVGEVFS